MVPTKLLKSEVDVPPVVEVSQRAKDVSVQVRATLTNVSDHDYVVHALGDDATHFWHVLDENHREVTRERSPGRRRRSRGRKAVDSLRTLTIAAGHSIHDTKTLELDPKKLKDGYTYTVRSEHWGQVAESEFVVIRPEPAEPPKKEKAKKKRTSKKK